MSSTKLFTAVCAIALTAAIALAVSTSVSTGSPAFAGEPTQESIATADSKDSPESGERQPDIAVTPTPVTEDASATESAPDDEFEAALQSNQEFFERYPEITHDHPPLECEPDLPAFTCSEVYWHRHDPQLSAHYGESGYTESILQCGAQTDYWRTDGKHPDGEQIITHLECDKDERIGPTPTVSS